MSSDTSTGATMAGGLRITAFFSSGTASANCTWANAATNCSSGGNFTVTFPTGSNTHPALASGVWTITNSRTNGNITSLLFDGMFASGANGYVAFDRCIISGNFVDLNPANTCSGAGSAEGTLGSNVGYSMGSATGGTSAVNGTVQYSNRLHRANEAAVGDLWGAVTLSFTGAGLAPSAAFTMQTDTDLLSVRTADAVPEPATVALLGAGLIGMGLLRGRKNLRRSI